MSNSRTINCKLTYKQLTLINDLIQDYIIRKDNEGIDVFSDEKCKLLRNASNEILSSYIGLK